jgi:hypothetical protein
MILMVEKLIFLSYYDRDGDCKVQSFFGRGKEGEVFGQLINDP